MIDRRQARVKFTAATAVAVPQMQVFPLDSGIVITVNNWTADDEAGEIHRGLVIDVDLDATDPRHAVSRAFGWGSAIVSLVAFGTSAAAASLRPLIAYVERTDGNCDVLQFGDWPIESSSRRMLKPERMRITIGRFSSLAKEDRDRVIRGLDWYRKSLSETNVFDRFMAAWTGLEAINPLLIRRYALPSTELTSAGTRYLITRRFGERERKQIFAFRQGLMHSTKPFAELIADADLATKTAIEALRLGLLELLRATPEDEAALTATPMRLPERNRVQYGYQMKLLQIVTVPLGQRAPRIHLRKHKAERTKMADGRTREHMIHDLEIVDYAGEILPPLDYRVTIPSADPDDQQRGMQITSFEIRSKDTDELIAKGTVTPITEDPEEKPTQE